MTLDPDKTLIYEIPADQVTSGPTWNDVDKILDKLGFVMTPFIKHGEWIRSVVIRKKGELDEPS